VAALIRNGELCRGCSGGKCKDLGTKEQPIEVECPGCNGEGCKQCEGGSFDLEGCPNRFCSSVVNAIDLIELFAKGLPPISGGVLDQSANFIHAARYFENEERRIKNERNS